MSGRYKVPFIVGPTPVRDHYMWPPIQDPAFSAIIAQGIPAFGTDRMQEYNWAIKRAAPEIVRALAWRVAEWTVSGGWGFTDDQYTDNTHSTLLGTISVANSFDVVNPQPKMTFATFQNDLATFTSPLVDEPRLVSESFGASQFGVNRKYIHDFTNAGPTLCGFHSFGCTTLKASTGGAGNYSQPMTSVVNGVTYDTFSKGDIWVDLFRDFGNLATFNAWRGCDMMKFHPEGDGPTGPSGAPSPTAFDLFFLLSSNHGGATNYGGLGTYVLVSGPSPLPPTPTLMPSNGNITIDPVIEASFTVPLVVMSGGYMNSVYPGSSSYVRTSDFCSLVMTATKFFEYCDSNGDPIFDATTGVQLRDPFG